jgi:hypothetical protein
MENKMKKADNVVNGKRIVVTHGELCFTPVDVEPTGKSTLHKLYIAGHSETGHHHVLRSDVEFEVFEGVERLIRIREVAELYHQKTFDIHETRTLTPGVYKVTEKTEYNPFTKVIQRVFD